MQAQGRGGATVTYREPPTYRQLLTMLVPAIVVVVVLTSAERDAARRAVWPWVAYAAVTVAAGLLTRRSLAATQLTGTGLRVRQIASLWRSFPWEAVETVTVPTDTSTDATARLRDGTNLRLRGMPLASAEELARSLAGLGDAPDRSDRPEQEPVGFPEPERSRSPGLDHAAGPTGGPRPADEDP